MGGKRPIFISTDGIREMMLSQCPLLNSYILNKKKTLYIQWTQQILVAGIKLNISAVVIGNGNILQDE